MGQQQYGNMAYPVQPGAVQYAQPFVQQPYAQPAQMYAQPVMMSQTGPQPPASIQCVICHANVSGTYFRCVGCKNNGRPGGYHICPSCHSRQRVREKGLFDELTQEMGQLTYNTTSERPHETYHPFEQINPVVAATPMYVVPSQVPGGAPQFVAMQQPVMAVAAPSRIHFMISCKELQKQGFGFTLPNPSVSASLNGKEIAHTEQQSQNCNPRFQRPIEVSNAEAKVTFTVYTNGTRHGVVSVQMSEILKSPGQTWSKGIEDPRTGHRLASGVVTVKWVPIQATPAVAGVAVAQPPYGQGPQGAVPYAQAPQYFAPPTYQ